MPNLLSAINQRDTHSKPFRYHSQIGKSRGTLNPKDNTKRVGALNIVDLCTLIAEVNECCGGKVTPQFCAWIAYIVRWSTFLLTGTDWVGSAHFMMKSSRVAESTQSSSGFSSTKSLSNSAVVCQTRSQSESVCALILLSWAEIPFKDSLPLFLIKIVCCMVMPTWMDSTKLLRRIRALCLMMRRATLSQVMTSMLIFRFIILRIMMPSQRDLLSLNSLLTSSSIIILTLVSPLSITNLKPFITHIYICPICGIQ